MKIASKEIWTLTTPRTQSLRDRVLEASAELTVYGEHGRTKAGAPEGPPLLPLVAEVKT